MPDKFTDAERGITPQDRQTDIAASPGVESAAAAPGEPAEPFKAVAFVLGKAGHRRAGHPPAEVKALYASSLKFIAKLNADAHRDIGYDPFEVVEFNTFDELISRDDVIFVGEVASVEPYALSTRDGDVIKTRVVFRVVDPLFGTTSVQEAFDFLGGECGVLTGFGGLAHVFQRDEEAGHFWNSRFNHAGGEAARW